VRVRVLRYLTEKPVTCPGLPYSLWALSDASGWLGWVPWLVRLWGIQEMRSLHLEISRFTIRVYVGPPLAGQRSPVAGCTRLFGASLATLIVLEVAVTHWGHISTILVVENEH
jgi:hypothetical protein